MKKILFLFTISLCQFKPLSAQVISRFTWDGPGATPLRADVGPDAISVNSGTVVSVIGSTAGVSNGALNAGSVAHRDINLTLLNSSVFNIPSIDVWVDFRREETGASFYTRGSSFDFGLNGSQLFINFSVENGSGGTTVINSGPIYAVPDDHIFHNYRFMYDNSTGRGYVWVDGITRYTYNGTAGRALVWSNASPVVGGLMDGTARNVAVLDNFELRLFSPAVLPLSFVAFSTTKKADYVLLNWSVSNEFNLSHFVLERSDDGINFKPVRQIIAKRAAIASNRYETADFDLHAHGAKVSYRIRSVDLDGHIQYSEIRVVNHDWITATARVAAFPNPSTGFVNLVLHNSEAADHTWTIYTTDGRQLLTGSRFLEKGKSTIRIVFPEASSVNSTLIIVVTNRRSTQKSVIRILRTPS